MDVIQLSQAGFGEACAPLGTAIRAEHIERLLKMTDHVIFSFDGDAAGRKAAKRAMDLSLPLLDDAQKVSFVFLLKAKILTVWSRSPEHSLSKRC